jgi:hypothetical protein
VELRLPGLRLHVEAEAEVLRVGEAMRAAVDGGAGRSATKRSSNVRGSSSSAVEPSLSRTTEL